MQHGPVSFAWLLCPAVVYLENRVLLTACDTHGRCLAPLTRGKEAARAGAREAPRGAAPAQAAGEAEMRPAATSFPLSAAGRVLPFPLNPSSPSVQAPSLLAIHVSKKSTYRIHGLSSRL